MPQTLDPAAEPVEDGLRRTARKIVDKALARGRDEDLPLAERVHEVRKKAKRLRALLRLARPAFPGYARENAAIRDAARRISGLRDRAAIREALDKLLPDEASRTRAAALLDRLDAAEREAADHPETGPRLEAALADLEEVRARIDGWTLKGKAGKALARGAARTYARGRAGWEAFRDTDRPDPAALHDWRKRTKYHRLHAEILGPVFPAAMAARADLADRLAETLGDHRDLHLLGPEIAAALDDAERAEVEARLIDRQRALEERARALGARLYADKPAALGRRWQAWIETPDPG